VEVEELRERAERQIGDGEIDNKDIPWCAHLRVPRDRPAHQAVSRRPEHHQRRKRRNDNRVGHVTVVSLRLPAQPHLIQEAGDLFRRQEGGIRVQRGVVCRH